MDRTVTGTPGDDALSGTSDDELFKGLAGNDVIDGGDGDDELVGNEGDDTLSGGRGDDRLFGCEDDDILDGGAGADLINAGSGNDVLIFTAAENVGDGIDYYDGHNGIDQLVLRLTVAEYAAARAEIDAFLAFIAATTGANGQSGGTSSTETGSNNAGQFFFFETLELAVRRIERLQVVVDGEVVLGEDPVVEDDDTAVGANGVVTGSVAANDTVPEDSTFELVEPPAEGALVFFPDGRFEYTPGGAFVGLGEGETAEVSFTYAVTTPFGDRLEAVGTITINGVNDAPVIAAALLETVSEDDAAFTLSLLDGASDPDTNDMLAVADLSVDPAEAAGIAVDGTTLSVDPSAYDFLAVGESRTVTVRYDVVDGNGGVTAQTATVVITGANDAPVVSAAIAVTASENDADFQLSLLDGASDPDSSDVLAIANLTIEPANADGISAPDGDGRISVSPSAYDALDAGETAVIVLRYDVVDGNGGVVAQTATITIIGADEPNTPPVISGAVSGAFEEDAVIAGEALFTLDLLDGASDGEGDALTIENVQFGGFLSGDFDVTIDGGTLSLPTDQAAFQSLGQGQSETVTLSYDIVDARGARTQQTAEITVSGTNDAPVANLLERSSSEDAPSFVVDLLAEASDVDGGALSVVPGTIRMKVPDLPPIAEGSIIRRAAEFDGNTLVVDLSEYQGLAVGDTATINVSYRISDGFTEVPAAAVLTIIGENDAPTVAGPLEFRVVEDGSVGRFSLLEGADDIDNSDVLNVAALTGTVAGVSQDGNALVVDTSAFADLNEGDTRTVTLTYEINDGNGGTVPQTAVVIIEGRGGVDVADDAFAVNVGDTEIGNVGLNDTVPMGTVFSLVETVDAGQLLFNSDGTFDFDPGADFDDLLVGETRDVTFVYQVETPSGDMAMALAVITVTGTNTVPQFNDSLAARTEDDALFTVSLADLVGPDDDGPGPLGFSNIVIVDSLGTPLPGEAASVAGDVLTITPQFYNFLNAGESVTITVDFDVIDGAGTLGSQLTVVIEGVEDSPVAGAPVAVTVSESAAASDLTALVLAAVSDPDQGDDALLRVVGISGSGGDAAPDGAAFDGGRFLFDPASYADGLNVGDSLTVSVFVEVDDNSADAGATTALQRVDVTITGESPENQAPQVDGPLAGDFAEDAVIAGQTVFELDLLSGATDPDGDTLTAEGLTVDYSGVGTVTGSLDSDGVYRIDTAQTVFQSLAFGQTETLTLSYAISDGNGGMVPQTAVINVTGTNDLPTVGTPPTLDLTEDDAVATLSLLEGAGDIDEGDVLTIVGLVIDPADAAGISGPDALGNVTVDPSAYDSLAEGEVRTIAFSYTVADGNGGTVAQTAAITITGVNDAPVTSGPLDRSVSEDADVTVLNLLEGASDSDDGAVLSVEGFSVEPMDAMGISVPDSSGVITIDPSGYQFLSAGETEDIVISYTISDSLGGTVAQTATISIIGANDNPVTEPITITLSESDAAQTISLLQNASDIDQSDVLFVDGAVTALGDTAGLTLTASDFTVDPADYVSLDLGDTASFTLQYTIADGQGGSVVQDVSVTIQGESVLMSSFIEDSPSDTGLFQVGLLPDAFSPSDGYSIANGVIEYSGAGTPSATFDNSLGIVSFAPGEAVFQPLAQGATETITVTYDIVDPSGNLSPQTAIVTVLGANDAPVGDAPVVADVMESEAAFTVDLLELVSDIDIGDVLSVANLTVTDPDGLGDGGFSLSGSMLTITPSAYAALTSAETGQFTVSYDVVDGQGGATPLSFSFDVIGEDPSAQNPPGNFNLEDLITLFAVEDEGVVSTNTLNSVFTDPEGETLQFVGFLGPVPAGLTYNAVTDRFDFDATDPAYDALRDGEFETFIARFQLTDGNGGFSDATVTIEMFGINDAPTFTGALSLETTEDFTLEFLDLLEGATDADAGDTLRIANVRGIDGFEDAFVVDPVSGGLSIETIAGSLDFIGEGEREVFTLTFDIVDSFGGSVERTAEITVSGSNDAPIIFATHDVTIAAETVSMVAESLDGPSRTNMMVITSPNPFFRTIDLLAGAFDPDGDILEVTGFTISSASGDEYKDVFSIDADGILTINFSAATVNTYETIDLTYTISDGLATREQTITIQTVQPSVPVGTAPEFLGDTLLAFNFKESEVPPSVNLLDDMIDADGDTLSIESIVDLGPRATFGLDTSTGDYDLGNYDFLGVGETLVETFTIVIGDGTGYAVERQVEITIEGENDAPESFFSSTTFSLRESDGIRYLDLLNGVFDPDGDALTVSVSTLSTSGEIINFNLVDGQYFQVDAGVYGYLTDGESVQTDYRATVSDGNGGSFVFDFTLEINGENDLAVIYDRGRFFDNDIANYQSGVETAGYIIRAREVFGDEDSSLGRFSHDDDFTSVRVREDPDGLILPARIENGDIIFDPANLDSLLEAGDFEEFTIDWIGVTGDGEQVMGSFTYRIEGTTDASPFFTPRQESGKQDIAIYEPHRTLDEIEGEGADKADLLLISETPVVALVDLGSDFAEGEAMMTLDARRDAVADHLWIAEDIWGGRELVALLDDDFG